ncbi:MAG TPA: hypothetical protein PK605_06490 [Ignavibacteria bacterium]|nr:hypothetical protein [Bacteroidota bacterium]HRE11590.1 hypothetical protein [Ignavibacteria bacterium]HRF67024.1 hypothetical protein [Ignavibacteria bacterium]HRJ04034.1 hypothetical protein [Ignavibacteria bacterium]
MKKMSKVVTIRIITALMLVSLTLVGSDCEDFINQINQEPCTGGDITGTWTYIYNSGTTLDICPGEVVSFPNNSGGTATLTCPNQSAINRNYTVSGQTLTYTDTSIEYQVCFDGSGNLVLRGINTDRVLYYSSSISETTDSQSGSNGKNVSNNNSSEIEK